MRRATRPSVRRGASLVELLIGLALAASLLIATAVALDASLRSYQVNQEQSTLVQRARLAMHRVLTGIRAGEAHQPYDADAEDDFRAGLVVDDTGVEMLTSDGDAVVYRYDAPGKRVLAEVNGTTHTLLEGVEQFSVRMEPMRSPSYIKAGLEYDLLKRATILLTIRATGETTLPGETQSEQTLTMSSSTMPRRNAW